MKIQNIHPLNKKCKIKYIKCNKVLMGKALKSIT